MMEMFGICKYLVGLLAWPIPQMRDRLQHLWVGKKVLFILVEYHPGRTTNNFYLYP